MIDRTLRPALLAGVFLTALLPAAALASGGGMGGSSGGGMGEMPSQSAPTYDASTEYQHGLADLQAGKFRDAKTDFDHVLQSLPKDADTLFYSGMAKAGLGDLKGAQHAYAKALEVEPDRIDARRELAVTLTRLGQSDQAKAELDILQKRADACGDSCPQSADLKAAIATVQAAMAPKTAANTRPPSLLLVDSAHGDRSYVQAVRLINQGRYEDALAALKVASQVFGPHPDVLTYTGYTYRKLHQYDKAEAYYRQALAIAPNHVGATEYYGELMVVRGDMAGARRMLAKLENVCSFGCVETEDLRRWIDKGGPPQS
ncbi:MAG TPA: tetratricopeptide repeat protein [Caulobacteraceae bacterium]|jgi:tetratricopeptide (TPR) repeat protein|nr:tetratricopeptide repeat protein [Caulobacteraceae bacterium]